MVATVSAFVTVGSFSDAERPLCDPMGGAGIAVHVGDPPITLRPAYSASRRLGGRIPRDRRIRRPRTCATLHRRRPFSNIAAMNGPTIVVAGATGNLGGRIARALLERGASVRALVRHSTARDKLERLEQLGVTIATAELSSVFQLTPACSGASCVVSALAGLRDVIVEMQAGLLEAAIKADVPRFIPSDYSIDFTKFPPGENRNLDLRRDFHKRLDKTAIRATTIFCGAFAEMLTGQMPLILFKRKRVLYWGDADQRMDFTTMDDTAAFTASAALDPSTPRFLRIAGDQLSARELAAVASEVTGKNFRLFRAGGLGMLGALIKVARTVAPGEKELYPAWQGMQYMRNMFDGRAKLEPLDNDRYPSIRWTTARDVLSARRIS
jgi:nucleoside-diphosphate-sugar epimerase